LKSSQISLWTILNKKGHHTFSKLIMANMYRTVHGINSLRLFLHGIFLCMVLDISKPSAFGNLLICICVHSGLKTLYRPTYSNSILDLVPLSTLTMYINASSTESRAIFLVWNRLVTVHPLSISLSTIKQIFYSPTAQLKLIFLSRHTQGVPPFLFGYKLSLFSILSFTFMSLLLSQHNPPTDQLRLISPLPGKWVVVVFPFNLASPQIT
jgi:hypothetical protein